MEEKHERNSQESVKAYNGDWKSVIVPMAIFILLMSLLFALAYMASDDYLLS